jgi:hypothetical protein
VSTGVPEWYLKQEFGRARGLGGQDIPLLDLPPKAAAVVEAARLGTRPKPVADASYSRWPRSQASLLAEVRP